MIQKDDGHERERRPRGCPVRMRARRVTGEHPQARAADDHGTKDTGVETGTGGGRPACRQVRSDAPSDRSPLKPVQRMLLVPPAGVLLSRAGGFAAVLISMQPDYPNQPSQEKLEVAAHDLEGHLEEQSRALAAWRQPSPRSGRERGGVKT